MSDTEKLLEKAKNEYTNSFKKHVWKCFKYLIFGIILLFLVFLIIH